MRTVLYANAGYPDQSVERAIYGEADIRFRSVETLDALPDTDCAAAEGLLVFRTPVRGTDLPRFTRLRAVVRMGVGYDRVDRAACAQRGILVCNVPDYGTTEVADHALAMVLALRRGLLLHHDLQRDSAAWAVVRDPLVRRSSGQVFGIVGLGRIGTAVALRARALGFRVVFHDPALPNGVDLALGVARARTLDDLLREADVLSLHAPLTPATRGLIDARALALMPEGAVLVNTARGALVDLDALHDALRDGHLAGAALDVLPEEPPRAPLPALLAAYRARAAWTMGRLLVTPHSAYFTPEAFDDIRRKSAETMHAALFTDAPQNVVAPGDW